MQLIAMKFDDPGLPEESTADLASWKWLHCLIKMFSEHSMSSEESSMENGVENVLQVKQMNWQRNIDCELDIIDCKCILDCNIFTPQGSKPLSRKRAYDNPTTSRKPVTGLPVALYDSAWFLQLTECQAEALQPSEEVFV
ncbi:hypothetical protein L210DRAFT_3646322 [Boletus edulis BED1]|uniref:Uncharacterized protein n=1 Tax=Boletus edulis BED1 TaxID=1328754 RepID=A0AAD4BSC7_BOLED|nr:hypothetical protein L210DRAFT_3646322 [Boletus edulis BED1]